MRYFLENEALKVEIDTHGAELKAITDVKTGREYLWDANPKYWARTAPVLFPFTGQLALHSFRYEGKTYPMGQHGFARDNEHTFVSQTETEISFVYESSEETLKKYPLPFKLETTYKLEGRKVNQSWKVTNPGEETLNFSIGSHPAFRCPVHGEEDKVGYQLRFIGFPDALPYNMNNTMTGLLMPQVHKLALKDEKVSISRPFFDYGTYMPVNTGLTCVELQDPAGKPIVNVTCEGSTFAIWSPEKKNAPFICIEPWYGCCDPYEFTGELKDQPYHNHLEAGETWTGEYTMEFFEI